MLTDRLLVYWQPYMIVVIAVYNKYIIIHVLSIHLSPLAVYRKWADTTLIR